jgi:hypothetical protein
VSSFASMAEAADTRRIAALARDPAPDKRLAALRLAVEVWRREDERLRRPVEAEMLAILKGLDYFARVECASEIASRGEAPRVLLDFLLTDDPELHGLLAAVRPLGRTNSRAFTEARAIAPAPRPPEIRTPDADGPELPAPPSGAPMRDASMREAGMREDGTVRLIKLIEAGDVDAVVHALACRSGHAPGHLRHIMRAGAVQPLAQVVRDCGFGAALLAALLTLSPSDGRRAPDVIGALLTLEQIDLSAAA